MKQKIVYIGLDVDDTQYQGSALNKETGEFLNFRCRPTLKGLLWQLAKIRKHFPKHTVQVAYEASYVGFTLQRELVGKGVHCDVVGPSSIPRQGGKAIKTDRIDAVQLAQFYYGAAHMVEAKLVWPNHSDTPVLLQDSWYQTFFCWQRAAQVLTLYA